MKEFHCILQTKGGIGKSLVGSWFCQYLLDQGRDVLAIECDQSNRTLSRYDRIRTDRLDLLDREQQIDRRRFDALIEQLVADTEPVVVMDNGQASFVPLTKYLVECEALSLLRSAGRESYVHCVITGGQLGPSTHAGLRMVLAELAHEAQIVVWHNAHFGPVDVAAYEKILDDAATSVVGPIRLASWSKPFEDDVRDMLEGFLTFDEALAAFPLMSRQRLSMVKDRLFGEIQFALPNTIAEVVHA